MYICTELYYTCDKTNYLKFSGIRPHTFTILPLGRSEVSFSGLKSKCQQSCIPFGESIPCFFQLLHFFPIGPHHSTLHYHHSSYFSPWLSFKDLSDYTGLIQMCVLSRFSRVWLYVPLDCSLPGSSVRGILQARILEWAATPSSRGSSQPRDQTCISYVSCIGRQVLYHLHHLGSPDNHPDNPT